MSKAKTINRPLLLKTLAVIEEKPEAWSQGDWATKDPQCLPEKNICGTAFCFAGWALVNSGYKPEWTEGSNYTGEFVSKRGKVVDAETKAQKLLNLTDEQSGNLFSGNNTLEEIRDQVASLLTVSDYDQNVALKQDKEW